MELPAVNTPQFDWARTRMPHQPRPVAPVVEPEVIANAVFEAVGNPRREYWIGLSTLKVILGNMVLPAFLDRYLANVAFGGQQTDAAGFWRPQGQSRGAGSFAAPDTRALRE